jgi:hypothetical protein
MDGHESALERLRGTAPGGGHDASSDAVPGWDCQLHPVCYEVSRWHERVCHEML